MPATMLDRSAASGMQKFVMADGHHSNPSCNIRQPVTAGIISGETLDLHCMDNPGNKTLPLFPISEMRRLGMIVRYSTSEISFENNPGVWHKMPTSSKGLMLIPLTEEAVERYTPGQASH